VLGRVFDVFLRASFESKGGLGVYLTPAPVKQAMVAIAIHDILEESPEILTAAKRTALPYSIGNRLKYSQLSYKAGP
jgi:type I restriction enzyme M protein